LARARLTFRQTDVTRAIKAARAAGVEIARVELDRQGNIVIIPGKASAVIERNEWDEILNGTHSS
jgi:hypothetical protein